MNIEVRRPPVVQNLSRESSRSVQNGPPVNTAGHGCCFRGCTNIRLTRSRQPADSLSTALKVP